MTTDCAPPDPTITVTFTPTVGDPLDLTDECADESGLWWSQLSYPQFTLRETTAPPSMWVAGQVLLASVPDASALIMQVEARGTDLDDLEAQKALLDAVVAGWTYTVEVEVANILGSASLGSWVARPAIPYWGVITPADFGLFIASAALSVPVNPVGAP